MINGAAAVTAQHAGGVGVIYHHDGAVLFGEIAERGQRADIAIHGEDAVGDQQLMARLILDGGQLFFRVGHVFVAEDQNFRARKPGAINDAGVVQLVADDEIVFAENRGDGAGVGGES